MHLRIHRIVMSAALPVPAESTPVEAARHALLRRLAPSLRHDAVASLQPIALAGGVLERRLQSPQPDLAGVQGGVQQLIDCSRHAVQSCLDVIAWLGLDPAREIPLDQAIAHAVALLQGTLGFSGFTLRVEGPGSSAPVDAMRLRYVLPACLLWLSDGASAPAELVLRAVDARQPIGVQDRTGATAGAQAPDAAGSEAGLAGVRLSIEPTPDASDAHLHLADPAYRPLRDEEIQALAAADGVRLLWSGDSLTLAILR